MVFSGDSDAGFADEVEVNASQLKVVSSVNGERRLAAKG